MDKLSQSFFLPGEVALIGAGPGDPELLTLKALKYLQAADVVLVDDLVNPLILKNINRNARIIEVGKRGGCNSTPQSFIEKQLISEAKSGRRVVRLKGGDPLLFGRGGEEMEVLHLAGIKVTVINGVSSGFAAANSLGVSLTHRECAAGVVFVTGHLKNAQEQPNWDVLVKTGMTLVVYMGLSRCAEIQTQLINAGMAPDTPVGLVQSATCETQQVVTTRLSSLRHTAEQRQLKSPVIIIIGDVVHGARQIQNMSKAA